MQLIRDNTNSNWYYVKADLFPSFSNWVQKNYELVEKSVVQSLTVRIDGSNILVPLTSCHRRCVWIWIHHQCRSWARFCRQDRVQPGCIPWWSRSCIHARFGHPSVVEQAVRDEYSVHRKRPRSLRFCRRRVDDNRRPRMGDDPVRSMVFVHW